MRFRRPGCRRTVPPASRRRLFIEPLETRLLLVAGWQNLVLNLDTNIDGLVTPIDALVGINQLNNPTVIGENGLLPDRADHRDQPLWNTNGDDFFSSNDILLIVNALNRPQPPVISADLLEDTAPDGSTNTDRITSNPIVSGTVTDQTGVQSLLAEVDGGDPVPVTFDPFGGFAFAPTNLDDGPHSVRLTAFDGNRDESDPVTVSFTLDSTAPMLEVFTPTANGRIHANTSISVALNNEVAVESASVVYQFDDGGLTSVPLNAANDQFEGLMNTLGLADGRHTLTITATDQVGLSSTKQLQVDLARTQAGSFNVSKFTPKSGAHEVGVTFRPQVFFSEPVDTATLTAESFFASVNGEKLPTRIVPANDGSFAWLYFTEPMPGATRVTVTVDGAGIVSQSGNRLDANANGTPGGKLTYSYSTVSLAPLPGTTLTGLVVDPGPDLEPHTADDFDPGPDGLRDTDDDVYLLPIPGVEVFLVGMENRKVVTDAAGRFVIDPVPAGNVKVAVEGKTATSPPPGFFFPEMVMDANMAPLQVNFTMHEMEVLYLPRLANSILETVSADTPAMLEASADGAPTLTPEERQRLTIDIPASSLIGPNGLPVASAEIGISTVPPELVVDMLPPGIREHTFDITIQALGVELFSTPAPMSFPNVFGTPPGTKHNFLSFDHTTGRLSIEGTATVSEDGLAIVTDPGFGITHPGWHGPIGRRTPTEPCPTLLHDLEVNPSLTYGFLENPDDVTPFRSSVFFDDEGEFTLFFKNNAARLDDNTSECSATNSIAIPLEVKITVDGFADKFLDGLETQEITLLPEMEEKIEVQVKDLLANSRGLTEDELFGTKVKVEVSKKGEEELLVDEEFYLYRLLEIADPDHIDAKLEFADTANDGQGLGGAVRRRPLKLTMDAETQPELQLSDRQNFDFEEDSGFIFDPQQTGQNLSSVVSIIPPAPEGASSVGSFSLEGDGEVFGVALDDDAFLDTLRDLASGDLAGASPAERALLTGSEETILGLVKDRFHLLGAGLVTRGPDGMLRTSDDGGLSLGDVVENPITISSFTSAGAQLEPPGATTIGQASQTDISGLDAIGLILGFPGVHPAERGFRVAEMLNETAGGSIEIYLDRMFEIAEFVSVQEVANAFTKTLLHEAGHEAGLVHTSTNFEGSILGFKFEDLEADGVYDFFFDSPLPGIEIAILNDSGIEVARTVTDNNGIFLVNGLPPGQYTVREETSSLNPTKSGSVIAGEHQFTWCPSTPTSHQVSVSAGELTEVPDFGNFRKVPISGVKYEDENGNGQRDPGEMPISGWEMTLKDEQGNVLQTATTNANGRFEFANEVDPGRYVVEEEVQPDWEASADRATTNGRALADSNNDPAITDFEVVSGDVVQIEFLNYSLADIHGHKFDEEGEPLGGFTIVLHKPDGSMETDVTDAATGRYDFSDLPPGIYTITEVVPTGFVLIAPPSGQHTVDHTQGSLHATSFLETPFDFRNKLLLAELDFGDAPDPTYPTLAASLGAAHFVDPDFHLGDLIDADSDGQPDSTASGDDTMDDDDEDGVTFGSTLIPGQVVDLSVTASAAGRLDAFVDFNRDGDWEEANEKVFHDLPLVAGANAIAFAVPPGAVPGGTFARFRLSTAGGLEATGTAADGEVEDYQVEIAATDFDYGDAPDPTYPTLLAQDGARHLVQPGFALGVSVDAEADGQPNVDATGDDADSLDEDGVIFVTDLVPGNTATIQVSATAVGRLDAFMDFNGDGDWNDAGEQIFRSEPLNAGSNDLLFRVPLSTAPGSDLFSRFRFSSAGGLTPTGGAADGEVEDHQVQVAAIELDFGDAPDPTFPTLTASDGARHILAGELFLGASVDADADGQTDLHADGDDADGEDDEDGIDFIDLLVAGESAQIIATASAAGRLDAWLDANADGDWDDRNEQVLVSVPLAAGENLVEFDVPGTTRAGEPTFARFRLSSEGGLQPFGLAANGEVEDYEVVILPGVPGTTDEVDADPIALPGAAANRDIMAQGLDDKGLLRFEMTNSALKIALGLNWSAAAIDEALSYYGRYLVTSALNGFFLDEVIEPGLQVPAVNGAALQVASTTTDLLVSAFDFGSILVDGPGEEVFEETFVLQNIGDQPLTISSVTFDDREDLVVTPPADNTVLQPLESTTLTVAFDPLDSGPLESLVEIVHDGLGAPFLLDLAGFGFTAEGDIRADVPLNNLGGVEVGAGPVVFEDFATLRNIGAQPLSIFEIVMGDVGIEQYEVQLPDDVTIPFEIAPGESLPLTLVFEPATGGFIRGKIQVLSDDPQTPTFSIPVVGTGLNGTQGESPLGEVGNDYVAFESLEGTPVFRTRSDAGGNYSFNLAPDSPVHYVVFDPVSDLIHESYTVTAGPGETTLLPELVFGPDTSPDTDGDGLPDDTELAIGTSRTKVDTNGDGVSDFAAIRQGVDPLGEFTAITGQVGLFPLDAQPSELVVAAHPQNPNRMLAYVLIPGFNSRLRIIDVTDASMPIGLSSVSLTGGTDLALDAARQRAVISGGQGGLQVIDISDPDAPSFSHTLDARFGFEVEVYDEFAYTTDNFLLKAIELSTGREVDSLPLGFDEQFSDIVREGNYLYLVRSLFGPPILQVVELATDGSGQMTERGSIALPGMNGPFAVQNGVLFAQTTPGGAGLPTVDVSDPDRPRRIEDGVDVVLPAGDLAASGSGLVYLVGRDPGSTAPFSLIVVDSSDPATSSVVASFDLDDAPRSLQVGAGKVFIATNSALRVFNFPAFDTQEAPPTATLTTPRDDDLARDGIQIIEGEHLPLFAIGTTDDVQLRQVQLLINGQFVTSDFNAPYDLSIRAPMIDEVGNTVTVRSQAIDTGGNPAISEPLTIELIRDNRAPRIVRVDPIDGGFRPAGPVNVQLEFSEAVDAAARDPQFYTLRSESGAVIVADETSFTATTAHLSFANLTAGEYELTVDAANIVDLFGNTLAGQTVSRFQVESGDVFWINPEGGRWDEPTNWNTGAVPGATDDVVIGVDGEVTITLQGGTVNRILSEERLDGVITLNGDSQLRGGIEIRNGFDSEPLVFNASVTLDGSSVLLGELQGTGSVTNEGTVFFRPGDNDNTGGRIHLPLHNEGLILHDNAGIELSGDGVIHNLPGAVYEFRHEGVLNGAINNSGEVKKSGVFNATLDELNSSGSPINVHAGELVIDRGSNTDTTIQIDAGAKLRLFNGDHVFAGTTTVEGQGTFQPHRGTVTIPVGSTLTVDLPGETFELGASGRGLDILVEGTLINRGHAVWGGADLLMGNAGEFISEGTVDITNDTRDVMGRITNRGTVVHSNGVLILNNATIVNEAGATWEIQGTPLLDDQPVTSSEFQNEGLLKKTLDDGIATWDVPLIGAGPIDLEAGTLLLARGGDFTDLAVDVALDAALQFGFGHDYLIRGNATMSGDGLVEVARGTLIVQPDASLDLQLLTGGFTVRPSLAAEGIRIEGTATNHGLLTLQRGRFDVPGSFDNAATASWSGGAVAGTGFKNSGSIEIVDNAVPTLNGVLTNEGTINHHTTHNFTFQDGSLENEVGASYNLLANGGFVTGFGSTTQTFRNLGTFTKNSDGLSTLGVDVDNLALMDVQQGVLSLTRGGTNVDAQYQVADGATFRLNQGNHSLAGDTSATGEGAFIIGGGTTVVEAGGTATFDLSGNSFEMTAGTLTVDGLAINADTGLWSGGTINGDGEFRNTGTLDLGGSGFKVLSVDMNNQGIVRHTTTRQVSVIDATLTNAAGGTYELVSNFAFDRGFGSTTQAFDNEGAFLRSESDGTVTFNIDFNNSGTVDLQSGSTTFARGFLQSDGSVQLSGGDVSVNNFTLDLQAGQLSGSGTIAGNVVNAGTIEVGGAATAGTLTVTRSYEQTSSGTLNLEVGGTAAGESDQLVTNSASGAQTATLDGTLNISVLSGASIAADDVYSMVTYDSVNGDFATTTGLDIGGGLVLVKDVGATELTLTAAAALKLSGERVRNGSVAPLTLDALAPVLDSAVARFEAAGLPASALEALRSAEVTIVDLPGTTLGAVASGRILIDVNAAGFGWFSDAHPKENQESTGTNAERVPADQVDLFSVLAHELAHLLGVDHDESKMDELIGVGERRSPFEHAVDEYFTSFRSEEE